MQLQVTVQAEADSLVGAADGLLVTGAIATSAEGGEEAAAVAHCRGQSGAVSAAP